MKTKSELLQEYISNNEICLDKKHIRWCYSEDKKNHRLKSKDTFENYFVDIAKGYVPNELRSVVKRNIHLF